MSTAEDEVCRFRNMFCKIKYIVFKIKLICKSDNDYLGSLEI